MKLLITAILFLFLPTEDWVEDAMTGVKRVDSEAKLKKEKSYSLENGLQGTYSSYKLKKENLIIVTGTDTTLKWGSTHKTYMNNYNIYAYLVKGLYQDSSGVVKNGKLLIGSIVEENSYFKNEHEGIAFIRKIDVYEGDNQDSLKLELQQLKFEKKQLDSSTYAAIKLFNNYAYYLD